MGLEDRWLGIYIGKNGLGLAWEYKQGEKRLGLELKVEVCLELVYISCVQKNLWFRLQSNFMCWWLEIRLFTFLRIWKGLKADIFWQGLGWYERSIRFQKASHWSYKKQKIRQKKILVAL